MTPPAASAAARSRDAPRRTTAPPSARDAQAAAISGPAGRSHPARSRTRVGRAGACRRARGGGGDPPAARPPDPGTVVDRGDRVRVDRDRDDAAGAAEAERRDRPLARARNAAAARERDAERRKLRSGRGRTGRSQAEHAGMELIPSGALRFLTAHPASDVSKAAAALSAPIAATDDRPGKHTASKTSTIGERDADAVGRPRRLNRAATSDTSAGEASTPAGCHRHRSGGRRRRRPRRAKPRPPARARQPPVGTSAGGASEAAGASTPTGQSAPTSTGGGTLGG